jgi:hypothetical protein
LHLGVNTGRHGPFLIRIESQRLAVGVIGRFVAAMRVEDTAKPAPCLGGVRLERQGFFEIGEGVLVAIDVAQRGAAVAIGIGEVWPQCNRPVETRQRFLDAVQLVQNGPAIVVNIVVERGKSQCAVVIGERVFVAFKLHQSAAAIDVGVDKVRLRPDRRIETRKRGLHVVEIQKRIAAVVQRIGIARVER